MWRKCIHAGVLVGVAVLLLVFLFSVAFADTRVTAEEGFIPVEGGMVWYRAAGLQSEGTPLMVLHGGPGMTHFYLTSLEALAEERPVIFYDQLGCGNSMVTKEEDVTSLWTIDYFVNELQMVRDALDLDEVHILGHSWGSMLAVEYMTRKDPEGVKSLILAGPFMSTQRWIADAKLLLETLPEKTQKVVAEAERKGDYDNPAYQEAMNEFYGKFFCRLDPWPPSLNKAFETMGYDVYGYMWGPSEFTSTGTLKEHQVIDKLDEIAVPTLFTAGEYDEARPETAEYYASLVPDSALVIIENASHCHHLEQPEEFNSIISEFMKKHEK